MKQKYNAVMFFISFNITTWSHFLLRVILQCSFYFRSHAFGYGSASGLIIFESNGHFILISIVLL